MMYWQHTGEILSSRYAKYLLEQTTSVAFEASEPHVEVQQDPALAQLRTRIAQVTSTRPQDVMLYPSGMAAIYACLRLLGEFRPGRKSVMFGFPYLDSLKLLKRPEFGGGVHFFPKATEDDFVALEQVLQNEEIVAIFTEFPGNPLPRSTDILRLRDMAHANGTVLVVDDTIGSFNINVLEHNAADLVATSLTKLFSGSGNVMGGSVILNPASPKYAQLQEKLQTRSDSFLFARDALVLLRASDNLEERRKRVNASAYDLVERLRAHARVKAVYYPSTVDAMRYEYFLRHTDTPQEKQYGPVFSLLLHGAEQEAQAFYNALTFAKGPSLGTNFTLCCPYTMLAHYDELDFVESCGIDRNLIRVSVGLEPVEKIWACFEIAFATLSSL